MLKLIILRIRKSPFQISPLMKDLLLLACTVLFQVIGNLFLSHGMHEVGELNLWNSIDWILFFHKTLINPSVLIGLICLGGYFLCFLIALSRLDFSYVQPMLAANYVLTAFLAWLVLKETVTDLRWLGIVSIAVGIVVVGLDEHRRRRRHNQIS